MGEAADDILEGLCCQYCGEWFDDVLGGAEAPGYPRSCEGCDDDNEDDLFEDQDEAFERFDRESLSLIKKRKK